MGGSATLGGSIIDGLSPVIDALRESLDPTLGHRTFTATRITRTWPSGIPGDTSAGAPVDVEDLIEPAPRVDAWTGFEGRMVPCGLDEAGRIQLSEISISYTEAELYPVGSLDAGDEFYIRLDDAHGNEIRSRLFTVADPPYLDREGRGGRIPGWVVTLRRAPEIA